MCVQKTTRWAIFTVIFAACSACHCTIPTASFAAESPKRTVSSAPAIIKPIRKKIIVAGWCTRPPKYIREHLEEIEKAPFDGGIIFNIAAEGVRNGKPLKATRYTIWQNWKWKREWFEEVLADIKACKFKKFKHNFLRGTASPGNLSWFNEEGWAAVANNFAILAWLAKEGGLKGIALDIESYGEAQWAYKPSKEHSFLETYTAARRHGATFMRAIAKEYPDMTLLAFFFMSMNLRQASAADPLGALAAHKYGLCPAFFDGMLDALPPEMKLVDGTENSYPYNEEIMFLREYNQIRTVGRLLVSPENRRKYRAQVQIGFGLYLDPYANPKGHKNYMGERFGSRTNHFRHSLCAAVAATDEYVWLWGEKYKWWRVGNEDSESFRKSREKNPNYSRFWEEMIPGITRAIEYARDPVAFARREFARLRAKGKLTNMMINGGFEQDSAKRVEKIRADWERKGAPPGWTAWQRKPKNRKPGIFSWDRTFGCNSNGSAKAVGVKDGCFIQKHNVKPKEMYAVEALALPKGQTVCSIRVRWQISKGNKDEWVAQQKDRIIAFQRTGSDWRKAFGVVTVPEGASRLVILLGVRAQKLEDDICWFDNVGLYKVGD